MRVWSFGTTLCLTASLTVAGAGCEDEKQLEDMVEDESPAEVEQAEERAEAKAEARGEGPVDQELAGEVAEEREELAEDTDLRGLDTKNEGETAAETLEE
jgi:hypothetical protein